MTKIYYTIVCDSVNSTRKHWCSLWSRRELAVRASIPNVLLSNRGPKTQYSFLLFYRYKDLIALNMYVFYFCQYLSAFHALLSIFIHFSCTSLNIYQLFMHFCQYSSAFHALLSIFIRFSCISVYISVFAHFCQYLSAFHALLSIFIPFSCSCQNCAVICFPNSQITRVFACSWP